MSSELQPTNDEILLARTLVAAQGDDAATEDGQRLAEMLRAHPDALPWLTDLGYTAAKRAIEILEPSPATKGILRGAIDRLRDSLGHAEASPAERLLIDQVMLCHLRLYIAEQEYNAVVNDDPSRGVATHWENRLSAIQRRYLRAVETLARVRKLLGGPSVQINIAAAGGQQVVANR